MCRLKPVAEIASVLFSAIATTAERPAFRVKRSLYTASFL